MAMAQQQQQNEDIMSLLGTHCTKLPGQEIYMSHEEDVTHEFLSSHDDHLPIMSTSGIQSQQSSRPQRHHDMPQSNTHYQQQMYNGHQADMFMAADQNHQQTNTAQMSTMSCQAPITGPSQQQQSLQSNEPGLILSQMHDSGQPQQQIELYSMQTRQRTPQIIPQQHPPQPLLQNPPPNQVQYHALQQVPNLEQPQEAKPLDPTVGWSYDLGQASFPDTISQAPIPSCSRALSPTNSAHQNFQDKSYPHSHPQPLSQTQPQHAQSSQPGMHLQQSYEPVIQPEYNHQRPLQNLQQHPGQYTAPVYPDQCQPQLQQLMPPPHAVYPNIMQCENQNRSVMVPTSRYSTPVANQGFRVGMNRYANGRYQGLQYLEIPYHQAEGEVWSSIAYHELDKRLGEKYQAINPIVSVDGYTHPQCSDRFCVGVLSNVNRNEFIEFIRRRIGKGVKLSYINHDIYVECLSGSCIFVTSPMMSIEENSEPDTRLLKISPGESVKVFSNAQFSSALSNAISIGFESVFKLTSYCNFKVSFVKGWGANYKRRTVLEAPCWIEVQLNGPLLWLDKVLRELKPPAGCGSTS